MRGHNVQIVQKLRSQCPDCTKTQVTMSSLPTFFKQKKRMNKLVKLGICDIGSLREVSRLLGFLMMLGKFYDAT